MSKNVDFRKLGEGRFEVRLPTGVRPSALAAAIFKVRGLATDALPEPERVKERPMAKLLRLATEAGARAGVPFDHFQRALENLFDPATEVVKEEDEDPENALDDHRALEQLAERRGVESESETDEPVLDAE